MVRSVQACMPDRRRLAPDHVVMHSLAERGQAATTLERPCCLRALRLRLNNEGVTVISVCCRWQDNRREEHSAVRRSRGTLAPDFDHRFHSMEIELAFTWPLAMYWSLNIFLASRCSMDKAMDSMHKVRIELGLLDPKPADTLHDWR